MIREVFPNSPNERIWIDDTGVKSDLKILLTLSNSFGEQTAVITPAGIHESKARLYVQAPPERVLTKIQQRRNKFANIYKISGYVISAVLISFSALSVAGLVKARVVLTGSMAPAIKSGDIVILTPPKFHSPKVGDIVAYTARRFDGSAVGTFTHRIIDGDSKAGFRVKGDANNSPDVQSPKMEDISGVVVFIIPFIGHFLTPRALLVLVPAIFGLWLVLDALRRDA